MKKYIPVMFVAAALGIAAPASAQFEMQTASVGARYKVTENSTGAVTANHLQETATLKAKVGLDRGKRISIVAGGATGTSFTSGWNNTGVGTGDPKHQLFLKQLYVAVAPVKGVEMQTGGLYLVRGESTELTSYDNDGYVAGGRLAVKRQLFLDEIALTTGYVGDTATPNLFTRFDRADRLDYHQALIGKTVGFVKLSADYTRHAGIGTVRQAVTVKTKAVIDGMRFEQYRRLDGRRAYGFAAQADKSLTKALSVSGGYATIDRHFGGLNGDKYGSGARLFANTSVTLGSALTASVYMTRAVGNDFPIGLRNRVDVALSYNVLKSFQKGRR